MPRATDQEERRGEIIRAVWQLIARRGIEGVSLRNVAAAAGISVGRIQHYFASKQELIRAGCQAMVDGAHAQYQETTAEEPPLERLRFILMHAIPATPSARFGTTLWYAYLAKAMDDGAIGELLADTKRGTEIECARLLRQAVAEETAAMADPAGAARRLLALADGLTVRVLVGDLAADEASAVLDAELSALRPRGWPGAG